MLNACVTPGFYSEDRLLMCLGSQRASLYEEGLSYTPKKGKVVFAPHKTNFVKNNGRYYYSCKKVGHKEYDRKNKKLHANVLLGPKKKAIWVPKILVTNLQGFKQVWVPKRN
jgi:hypothetical protein